MLKILFVCSGNKSDGQPGTVVQNQAESIKKEGVTIDYFLITQKGVKGYLKAVRPLMKKLQTEEYMFLHSHYSLSAFVSSFALIRLKNKKIQHVVSLMGSDAKLTGWKKKLTRYFNRKKWGHTIVKSELMAKDLGLKNYTVLPNGVDLDNVKPSGSLPENTPKKVLFAASPKRESKNFALAEAAFQQLDQQQLELEVIHGVPHAQVIEKINSADVVLLTSKWEGSPNIVKEAMACNRPIVATKVGDVPWLLEGLDGCFLVNSNPNDVALGIKKALDYSNSKGQTTGRQRIEELELSAQQVAKKIISLYTY